MRINPLWVGLTAVIIFLQFRLWAGEGSFSQAWLMQKKIEKQQIVNAELAERNRRLEAEVLDLRFAQSAIEERARNQLGMLYEDETFFLLVEPEQSQ